ncbi:glycosyltransferase [Limnoraphis robusta]|nr:glycosyltransferase [Limnoraphis robusta]
MTTVTEALRLAAQYQQAHDLTKAEQVYRQILQSQPRQPNALCGLGVLAQLQGQYQVAEKFLSAALQVQPNLAQGWLNLGNLHQVQGRLAEALEAYQRVVALNPNSVAAYNNIGYTLQLKDEWNQAIAYYQKACSLQPNNIEINVNLANALHTQGKLSPEQQIHYAAINHDLGVARKKAGDLKTAIVYYRQAIALQPNLALAHYNLGAALKASGKIEEAITSYQTALELNSKDKNADNSLIVQALNTLNCLQNQSPKIPASNRLKVAFVCQPFVMTSFPNPADSIGILTYELVKILAHQFNITVYAAGQQSRQMNIEGVDYQYIPISQDQSFLKYFEKLPFKNPKSPLFNHRFYYLGYGLRIAQNLRKQQFDIVHIHNCSQFVPIIRALNPQIKIVLHMHCEWLHQLDYKTTEQRLRQVDLVITPSDYITEAARQRFPQFSERIQTLANGVDLEKFVDSSLGYINPKSDAKSQAKQLLYVGRICPEKGSHILLEAFHKVLEKEPETQLTLVGPMGVIPYEYLVALSEDAKIKDLAVFHQGENWKVGLRNAFAKLNQIREDTVTLTGCLAPTKLPPYYQNADLFIFPSVCQEAFGMPVAEAMVAGVPVIVSDGGGLPELVENGKSGLVVERSNADALAEAILKLLTDETLRKSMGSSGHKRAVEQFSFEKIAEDLQQQYYQLCGQVEPQLNLTTLSPANPQAA